MFGSTGINAHVVFEITLCFLFISNAFAANPYKLGHVDYFHSKDELINEQQTTEDSFDFREPVINPDGKVSYFEPPSAMEMLLKNPSPNNAKKYLAWQKQRISRIIKAQQMIDNVINEDNEI